jgi:hypothetical protein
MEQYLVKLFSLATGGMYQQRLFKHKKVCTLVE